MKYFVVANVEVGSTNATQWFEIERKKLVEGAGDIGDIQKMITEDLDGRFAPLKHKVVVLSWQRFEEDDPI